MRELFYVNSVDDIQTFMQSHAYNIQSDADEYFTNNYYNYIIVICGFNKIKM